MYICIYVYKYKYRYRYIHKYVFVFVSSCLCLPRYLAFVVSLNKKGSHHRKTQGLFTIQDITPLCTRVRLCEYVCICWCLSRLCVSLDGQSE